MKNLYLLIYFLFATGWAMGQNAWINEFHYDNSGTDVEEFVEIVIESPGSYSLSDFKVNLYNGSNGASYASETVDNFTVGSTVGGYTVYYWVHPGIQNGAPDGLALSYQGHVISGQFLSYEGSFDAAGGPADGLTSTDIGVSETTSTPVGESLQLSGSGTRYSDFTWQSPATATEGAQNNGQTLTSGGSVKDEPTHQAASFAAGTPTATAVPLTWSDNDGAVAADGYLIMADTTGTFTAPADGTAQADDKDMADGAGQVNVAHGTGIYTFSDLSPGHNYYFKIWAYTNSGSTINYKTDGTVPTIHAATVSANTNLIISKVADPGDNSNARFVELYNPGSRTIDFGMTDWYLVKQVNGGSQYPVHLSGSIAPSCTYIVADNSSDFNGTYGFDPDQHNGNINGNGDDGYYLYYGGDENSGVLIDAYGVMGEDGTGKAWEYTDSKAVRKSTVTDPDATWTASEWDIASADAADMSPGTYGNCITWKGASSPDWGTSGNWVGGTAPASANVVKIPSGVANSAEVNESVSSPATCNSLIINSGASLTIDPGKALTVSGDLTDDGTLTLASDATGDGSLIVDGTPAGDVTAQQYIKAYLPGTDNGWHFIGPAVDAGVSGTGFEPGDNDDLFEWSEGQDLWMNWKDATTGNFSFERGQGLLIAKAAATDCSVTGPLKNSDVSFSNLSFTPEKGDGWHLLGNPFTSAITWGGSHWALSQVNGVAKLWNSSSGNYTDVNTGGIIPCFAGFFVQVSSSTNSITIPQANRIHDASGNHFKSISGRSNTLVFKVTDDSNGYYDINSLGFKSEATQGFDPALDSHKLFSFVKAAPQLWTVSDEQDFSTNYLPRSEENTPVALDFQAGVNSTYHLSWTGLGNMDPGLRFLLEDKQTGSIFNMSDRSGYDFDAVTTDDPGRFVLHINSTTGVPQAEADSKILVFTQGNELFVTAKDNSLLSGTLALHNLAGQLVYRTTLPGVTQQILHIQLSSGLYIVRMELKDGSLFTQKIVIR